MLFVLNRKHPCSRYCRCFLFFTCRCKRNKCILLCMRLSNPITRILIHALTHSFTHIQTYSLVTQDSIIARAAGEGRRVCKSTERKSLKRRCYMWRRGWDWIDAYTTYTIVQKSIVVFRGRPFLFWSSSDKVLLTHTYIGTV